MEKDILHDHSNYTTSLGKFKGHLEILLKHCNGDTTRIKERNGQAQNIIDMEAFKGMLGNKQL